MDADAYTRIYRSLDGVVALSVATRNAPLRKAKGEMDTEFVKRIVATYLTLAGQPVRDRLPKG